MIKSALLMEVDTTLTDVASSKGWSASKESTGALKELCALFLPICAVTLSNHLFVFFEKLFLARFSILEMGAALSGAYACQIFQASLVAMTMMAQVFVGRWYGAKDYQAIGPGIWQFIWFSFFSTFFVLPLGVLYGLYYFKDTAVETIVWPYYLSLLGMNCLFPLGAVLSSFYLGMGKARLVMMTTILSQLLKVFFGYYFILGIPDWFPGLGLMGGIYSTLIAQLAFCGVLGIKFLGKSYASAYNTRAWKIKGSLFWECIKTSGLRGLNRILTFASWASIAHLMSTRGEEYFLIFSIGGTLFLFIPFVPDAICQAQMTLISHTLGKKDYKKLSGILQAGVLLTTLFLALFMVPTVFAQETFQLLFPSVILDELSIFRTFWGIWLSFAFFSYSFMPVSFVLACKDTKFSLFMGFISWINGFLFIYVALESWEMPANAFWLVLSIMHVSVALFYYWRMQWLRKSLYRQPSS